MANNDAWFDRVPGGYYKAKAQAPDASRPSDNRRRSNDDYRPYEQGYDDERPPDDARDRGKRRDSHGDRDPYERSNRRYSMNDRSQDSRRFYDDNRSERQDEYSRRDVDTSYDDGRDRRSDEHYSPHRTTNQQPASHERRPISPFTAAAAGAYAGGMAAAYATNDVHAPTPRATRDEPSQPAYVPYANIYGSNGNSRGPSQQPFSPPSRGSISSPQPHSMNQLSPPRRGEVAAQSSQEHFANRGYDRPDHDGAYDERYRDGEHYDDRYRDHGHYDDRHRDRGGYDDRGRDERKSRSARPQRSDPRSHSWDSYDSRGSRGADSERRPSRAGGRARDRGKSAAGLSTTFDKSQRGLGYGAVGALAGGLVGSEVGKGAVPAAIGAVLGGLGANMFEAREKRRESTRNADFAKDDQLKARREKRDRERREREQEHERGRERDGSRLG